MFEIVCMIVCETQDMIIYSTFIPHRSMQSYYIGAWTGMAYTLMPLDQDEAYLKWLAKRQINAREPPLPLASLGDHKNDFFRV